MPCRKLYSPIPGHYSVVEPDGSMRTVEYSAHPKTGFTAVVNNGGEKVDQPESGRSFEDKAMREYGKFDFNDEAEFDSYLPLDNKKKSRHPFDTEFKDYSSKKRPKFPPDLESSEFSHSVSIKHPRDETGAASESHSHFGLDIDPNCKHKHKHFGAQGSNTNLYTNVVDGSRYPPLLTTDSFVQPSTLNFNKYVSQYDIGNKLPKLEPSLDYEKLISPYALAGRIPPLEGRYPTVQEFELNNRFRYPYVPDIPSVESLYDEDMPVRPRKKYRPNKESDYRYPSDDPENYWPKKKRKNPPRDREPDHSDEDEEYERPSRYPDDDDEYPTRNRGKGPKKEVIRKIIKKRKPGFNLLDILDI